MAETRNRNKNVRAVRTYTDMVRAVAAVTSLEGEQLGAFGLTVSQFAVMETLLHEGPLNLTELGHRTQRSESNASKVVENLGRRGLVVRRADGKDGRKISADLTVEGRELLSKVYPEYMRVVRARMSALKENEQERLQKLCRKLEEGDPVKFMLEMTRGE